MNMLPTLVAILLVMLIHTTSYATVSLAESTERSRHESIFKVVPSHPDIRYQGRWILDDPTAAKIGWAGSQLDIQFSGSSITVDIDPGSSHEFFRVLLNDKPIGESFKLMPGKQSVTLVEGLDPGKSNRLTLFKETYYGELSSFYGLEITNGRVQKLSPLPTKKIVFFGDSNMDGTSLYSEKDSGETGSYYAYPSMVGRMLNAQVNIQAFGGATLTENDGINVLDFITGKQKAFPNPLFKDSFGPDVIVINAGANDIYKANERPLEDAIIKRFVKVVEELRRVYGENPHIVLYNAYGWNTNEPANYTKKLPRILANINLSVLHYPWTWEQWHGAMAEHGGQARLLAKHIADNVVGFNIVKPADVFNGFGVNGNLANSSFEHVAPGEFNAFGWRYADDGVIRIQSNDASDGKYFIRLENSQQVHQGTDASGDYVRGGLRTEQSYLMSVDVRGQTKAVAELFADFEGQDLYQRKDKQSNQFEVTNEWQRVSAKFTAPAGSWKTYFGLSAAKGVVDFDNITVRLTEE